MKSVFLLQHCYEIDGVEDIKTIGIYSSKEKAEGVVKKYKDLPGFRDYSEDCFYIDEYQIDHDNWTEGFVSVNDDI